ncbi:alpha/beta hydrolase [Nocardioides sp. BSK12Z-3]|nr:alpha/beta hydrolase [Nocardioides bruguierae]
MLVLSGGPGCEHYLATESLAPTGRRCWFPWPRGVRPSGGGPHDMERAVADLEALRIGLGLGSWAVVGHSWGGDLALRYAVDHPEAVTCVVAVAARGPQRDRTWSEAYEAGKAFEKGVDVAFDAEVWAALRASFTTWTQHPLLWRSLAECPVPVELVAAGDDVRPAWPLGQLATLLPHARLTTVPDVPHDFWHTDPDRFVATVRQALGRHV